ncbi:homeobox-domain-containing protein [Wallemia mellicola]|nr:homeobox-domain-containing protein [Wallemia mellicola]
MMNYKPIQLFHPSSYQNNQTTSLDFDSQPQQQQSAHSNNQLQSQLLHYQPFQVKHRKRTSKHQFNVLEETYQSNPKPSAIIRKSLAEQLEMTPRGVQIWFQNRRAKAKAQAKKELDNPQQNSQNQSDSDSTPAPTLTPAPTNNVLSLDSNLPSNNHSQSNLLYPSPLPSPASGSLIPHSTSLSPTSLISNPFFDTHFNLQNTTRRGSAPLTHAPTNGLGLTIPQSQSLGYNLSALTSGGNIGPVRRASLPNFQTRRSNQSLRHSASRSKLATCTEESSPSSAYPISPTDQSLSTDGLVIHTSHDNNGNFTLNQSDSSSPTSTNHHQQSQHPQQHQILHSSSSNSLSHALATSDTFWRESSTYFDDNSDPDRRQSILSSNFDNNSLFDTCRRDSEVSTSATTTYGVGPYDNFYSSYPDPNRRDSCASDFIHTFEEFGVGSSVPPSAGAVGPTSHSHNFSNASVTDFVDYTLDPKEASEVENYVHC